MDSNIEVVRGIILAWYQGRLEAIEPGASQKDPKRACRSFFKGEENLYLLTQ